MCVPCGGLLPGCKVTALTQLNLLSPAFPSTTPGKLSSRQKYDPLYKRTRRRAPISGCRTTAKPGRDGKSRARAKVCRPWRRRHTALRKTKTGLFQFDLAQAAAQNSVAAPAVHLARCFTPGANAQHEFLKHKSKWVPVAYDSNRPPMHYPGHPTPGYIHIATLNDA